MKITNSYVKWFEREQEQYGTKVALGNAFWLLASEILKGVGVKRIRTSYAKKTRGAKNNS
jgi:hypothetical protein